MKKTNPGRSKMRKMFFTIVLLICSAFTLCAGDADDVKNVIIQRLKDIEAKKWDQVVSSYVKDYKTDGCTGGITFREKLKEMILMFDGAHPYEFFIFAYKTKKGKELTPEEKDLMKVISQTPEAQVEYEKACKFAAEKIKEIARLGLKTIKFHNVEVNGTAAIVIYGIDIFKDFESTEIVQEVVVCKLRKINGAWKIYEEVTTKK